jgi:predicted RNA binding protein YcfA (HicA-like mRNA interferase family)
MKRRLLEQHLLKQGCYLDHQGGKHEIWINPETDAQSTVPRHKEIKLGTARGICRQLGIPGPPSR